MAHNSEDGKADTPRPWTSRDRIPIFVVDASLHRVARYIRMMGIDCIWSPAFSYNPRDLLCLAADESRIILTTSMDLLDMISADNVTTDDCNSRGSQRLTCQRYFFVKGKDFAERLKHVTFHFGLDQALHHKHGYCPRCPECNFLMKLATPAEAQDKLPASAVMFFKEFWFCEPCNAVHPNVREDVIQALKRIETTNTGVLAPSSSRPQCTFILSRVPRCTVLRYLTLPEVGTLMRCCQAFCAMAQDNLFWKWKLEQQLHNLHYSQIMQSLRSRKIDAPFGHTPFRNSDDDPPKDPPKFWMSAYSNHFAPKSKNATRSSRPPSRATPDN